MQVYNEEDNNSNVTKGWRFGDMVSISAGIFSCTDTRA